MGKIEQKNLRFNLALVDHVKAYELIQNFNRNEYHNLSDYIVDCLIKFDEYERNKDKNKEYLLIDQLQERIDQLEKRLDQMEYGSEDESIYEFSENSNEIFNYNTDIAEFYAGLNLDD
ncbi:hypothetical protein [Anaerosacchariphilus polymeriproducens]|uniref:Uncharacterized protein n=1 Tax=Anaerosacchariphilus polymeriproducens TaxID=1812858 RepID=A0A371AV05_9FIRM|nr:hypothetical protein [Anaerosacchariphilus polymeriproducens]RDU23414.1 hypothetical protein DWV06_09410 [Anaerosacchariphilus polymeriproducens]